MLSRILSDRCLSHVCLSVNCGQTVGWLKMPLGPVVGLGPGDIVIGVDPAPALLPHGKGHSSEQTPIFLLVSIVAKQLPISATVELLLGDRL